jgi:hypothetical protein
MSYDNSGLDSLCDQLNLNSLVANVLYCFVSLLYRCGDA